MFFDAYERAMKYTKGNGIALPCAMFVMEGIAMILSEEDTDEQQ